MAYCPVCKRAFEPAVKECPQDHVALVKQLPFQAVPGDTTTWVEITSVGTDDEARLLQGFLQAEGINAQVENVKFHMEPINFGSMGEIRIYVAAEDEKRAMELLKQRDREYDQLDDDEDTLVTDEGPAEIDESANAENDTER